MITGRLYNNIRRLFGRKCYNWTFVLFYHFRLNRREIASFTCSRDALKSEEVGIPNQSTSLVDT